MDTGAAQRVAMMGTGGNGLTGLVKNSGDPNAARKTAQQFGAMLMQQLMRQSDGTAFPMAGGSGGAVVNAMFSTTMGQAAMAHDRTGLTDMLLNSIQQKQHKAGEMPSRTTAAATALPTALPLAAYWRSDGLRPFAAAMAGILSGRAPSVAPLLASMPNLNTKMVKLLGLGGGAAAAPEGTTFDAPPGRASGGASAADIANFVQKLGPMVQQAGQQLGVSPRILLAQAAIETGWGRSVVGNNMFGIKAGSSWTGAQVTTGTHEYMNGELVSIQDAFRAYPNAEASVRDFVQLVSNRYKAAMGSGDDVVSYAKRLLAGGWATDINYVGKLQSVASHPAVSAAFPATGAPTPLLPAAAAASARPVPPGQPTPLLPADFKVAGR